MLRGAPDAERGGMAISGADAEVARESAPSVSEQVSPVALLHLVFPSIALVSLSNRSISPLPLHCDTATTGGRYARPVDLTCGG